MGQVTNTFWDYRVIYTKSPEGSVYMRIHRVFYEDMDKKRAILIESAPAIIDGASRREMADSILLMVGAFDSPALNVPEGL